jgi:predicted PurR-regulated permease PerM
LIATVLSFVPYLGPILSALPAMLIALTDDPTKALVVAALYAGIQVVEGNAITPFIQQRALRLPAALLVATQFVMGALLGIGGIFLSTPFLVVVVILVQMLYVESALGEDVDVMGSH